jgi:hypothetical protein
MKTLMFSIFDGANLIGHSALDKGDPPMGVASGRFEPTDSFSAMRSRMKPARNGAREELSDARFVSGLSAQTADGTAISCSSVAVWEYGEAGAAFALEVECLGIGYPQYEELFPRHVQSYKDQFKK